jgi:transcriptional regulator with XRE-family HTH domain
MSINQDLLKIGKKIREYRLKAGMNQLELECAIGAASGSLSRIENGVVNPTKETIWAIIKVLNINKYEAADLFDLNIEKDNKLESEVNTLFEISTQKISDLAVQKLDFIGAMIFILDDTKKELMPWTVSTSKLVKYILTILPKNIRDYRQSLDHNTQNLVAKAYINRKIFSSINYADFTTPALPMTLAKFIQKFTGVQLSLAIPIMYLDDIFGVLMINTKKHTIEEIDMKAVDSYVEMMGIIMHNLIYLSELNK